MRRGGVAGLFLLVVGAPLGITNVGVSAATKNVVPTCSITSLRVTQEGASAGMTQTEQLFWIRNVSAHECSLKGYPMISFIDLAGKSRSPALRDQSGPTYTFYGNARGRGAPLVDLKPHGGLASFWLVGDDSYPPSNCVTSVIAKIDLPGSGGSTTVRARSKQFFDFCGVVSVDPIVTGLSGSIPARALADVPGFPSRAT
jgi:hypothetical protein